MSRALDSWPHINLNKYKTIILMFDFPLCKYLHRKYTDNANVSNMENWHRASE